MSSIQHHFDVNSRNMFVPASRADLLPTFDEEDVTNFCATPSCSHTNSQGHCLTYGRNHSPEPASDDESVGSWMPSTPSFLLHGSDMPSDLLAQIDSDPMPMLPCALDCGVF